MKNFQKIKFVFFLFISIGFTGFSQEGSIRIFEKKLPVNLSKCFDNFQHLVVIYYNNQTIYFQVNQNDSWKCDKVTLEDWQELPATTLVLLQPQEEAIYDKNNKKKVAPILLGSLSFSLAQLTAKNPSVYALSWSMRSFKEVDNSVQTSQKIISNNCCKNGMCSILIALNKKNNSISLLASN